MNTKTVLLVILSFVISFIIFFSSRLVTGYVFPSPYIGLSFYACSIGLFLVGIYYKFFEFDRTKIYVFSGSSIMSFLNIIYIMDKCILNMVCYGTDSLEYQKIFYILSSSLIIILAFSSPILIQESEDFLSKLSPNYEYGIKLLAFIYLFVSVISSYFTSRNLINTILFAIGVILSVNRTKPFIINGSTIVRYTENFLEYIGGYIDKNIIWTLYGMCLSGSFVYYQPISGYLIPYILTLLIYLSPYFFLKYKL